MRRPKPILVVKLPQSLTMYEIDKARGILNSIGLDKDYYLIVASSVSDETIFETSIYNEMGEVEFEKFKQLKQILENGKNDDSKGS